MTAVATIARAYGYYLGNPNGWDVVEANRFGALNLDWYCDVGTQADCGDFINAATAHLKAAGLEGVTFPLYGKLTPGSTDVYVLLAAQDSYASTTGWGDSLSLDPGPRTLEPEPAWAAQLSGALRTLGLTPHQEHPLWQFTASLRR